MEPFACKSLIMHLAWDHGLYMDTFTTDRSTSVKAMIGFVIIYFDHVSLFYSTVSWLMCYPLTTP